MIQRRARVLRAALALGLLALGWRSAHADDSTPVRLRYGWAPAQSWRAVYSVKREMHLAQDVQTDLGVARFDYAVHPDAKRGSLRLEVRFVSQETAAGPSPLDFTPIVFRAGTDALGHLRGPDVRIGDARPPDLPGIEPDPVAYRQILEQAASAWRQAAFWFPELPERPLAPGEEFVSRDDRDLGGGAPGTGMWMRSERRYRLVSVAQGIARFHVEEDSHVDAAAGSEGVASEQRAEGEALFDLALGMWTRHELVSSQRASFRGAPSAAAADATSHSVTTIEMQRLSPGPDRD
ncbi:MAG TPA: hypothetical protein VMS55_04130 [Myxococcota bacterium]|nr:hypothetical protein [Myxococcota bacterium]